MIYLDNNSTTCMAPEVLDAMMPYLQDAYGNPSSQHAMGGPVRKAIEQARSELASLIHADASEIIFTSGGTESNNMVLKGLLAMAGTPDRLITTAVEHSAVLIPAQTLQKAGRDVKILGVKANGCPSMEKLEAALEGSPALVSMMWANNETGILMPLQEAAERTRAAGGLIHSDAIQGLGKVPINVKETPVDFLSFSAHKAHGPKGVGALYIRKGLRLASLIEGGHHEAGKRAGTENVAGIIGFGEACRLMRADGDALFSTIREKRDRFEESLQAAFPDAVIHGRDLPRTCNTTSISFKGRESESMLLQLSNAGLAASAGSTCAAGLMQVSHVLKAMNIPPALARGTLRLSLSKYTRDEDIIEAVRILKSVLG
jgi:cysteine desulfurase